MIHLILKKLRQIGTLLLAVVCGGLLGVWFGLELINRGIIRI